MDKKCGSHRPRKGRYNVLFLILHVNSRDHVIKGPILMLVASTLKSLVTIGPVKLETKTFDLPYVTM